MSFNCTILVIIGIIVCCSCQCPNNYRCVPIDKCKNTGEVYYPCSDSEATEVCCPHNTVSVVSRTKEFPNECGYFNNDDKISAGEVAAIGQFPWMALLGFKHEQLDFVEFSCGGTLITTTHVLTAAHCNEGPRKPDVVRLGEWDTTTNSDCEELDGIKHCADPHKDVKVKRIIVHKKYNGTRLKNDIALVKLDEVIKFTEFIKPICLPFDMNLNIDSFYDRKLTVSGWGKTDATKLGGSTKLLYAAVKVWKKEKCNEFVPPEVRPIRDYQICANGPKKEDACKGDSGGPLANITVVGSDIRAVQYGIVSFAAARTCGQPELPTVYTRVDSYLGWIVKHAK